MLCVLPPTNQQTWLAITQVVAESTEFKFLLFETKFFRAFSRPQGKLVLWRYARVWRNYPHAVHKLQKPHLSQDRFESWVVKCTTSLKFRSLRNNVGKRLARCCYPFYRSKAKCYQLPPSPLCHLVRESWSDGFTPEGTYCWAVGLCGTFHRLHEDQTYRCSQEKNDKAQTHSRPWFQRHHSLFL